LNAFLIGAGHLGTAILGYKEMSSYSHKIVAAFDKDPRIIDQSIHGVRVFNISRAPELLKELNVRLAILTVPAEEAQKATDLLVKAGIQGIWNFTSANIVVPDGITIHKEDLISGLAVLSVKMARRV
jgi:redox-sensing transcriptional repressor